MPVTWTVKDRISSIVFIIKQAQKTKRLKRLWINSLEVDEVRKGFANLQDNRKDLLMYEEAKARQISDWLVGMNGSRLYSLLLQARGIREVFSIGRVQSPTVYLIYQRQREIETFVSEPFLKSKRLLLLQMEHIKGKQKQRNRKGKLSGIFLRNIIFIRNHLVSLHL